MRLHWKLMLTYISVVVLVMVSVQLYLDRAMNDFLVDHLEQMLLREVRFARAYLVREFTADTSDALDPLADAVGLHLGLRTTIIDGEGIVLGDSAVDLADLSALENHANRPEIKAAHVQGRGSSLRYSNTLGTEMLYVATAVPEVGGGRVVLRLAMPLRDVGQMKQPISRAIWMASILGLGLALLLAYGSSRYVSRPILGMIQMARDVASGVFTRNMPQGVTTQELRDLAAALDEMRRQIQTRIGQITLEKSRLEAVLTSITEGILVTDQSGRVSMTNRAFEKLFGVSQDSEGRMPIELVRHRDVQDAIEQTLETGQVVFLDLIRSDGLERYLDVHVAPILQDDVCMGSVTLFYDITELRRLERIRKDFVANVSHELRTPLTTIKGCAATLADGALDDREAAQRFVQMINTHADRLHSLVEDILDLSHMESGTLVLAPEICLVQHMVDSVVGQVSPLAKEKDIEIVVDVGQDVQVQCDRKLIEQALLNLLDNAIKYTPEGGVVQVQTRDFDGGENGQHRVSPEVGDAHIMSRNESLHGGRRIVLEVKDTGIGIPLLSMNQIFERFYRVDKGRARAMGGTGLGLSIVRHIMEAHGERVYVESEQGKGSTFALTLPEV